MKNADMPVSPWMMPNGSVMTLNGDDDEAFVKQCKPAIGLTKREHFAAMAMQGLLANDGAVARIAEAGDDNNLSPDGLLATAATSMADALLAELERTQ